MTRSSRIKALELQVDERKAEIESRLLEIVSQFTREEVRNAFDGDEVKLMEIENKLERLGFEDLVNQYFAMLTPKEREDLERIQEETDNEEPSFEYSDHPETAQLAKVEIRLIESEDWNVSKQNR